MSGVSSLGTIESLLFNTYYGLSSTNLDYAIGVEDNDMFFTTEYNTTGYKFYGGTTLAATLSGGGNLTTSGSVTCTSLSATGNG